MVATGSPVIGNPLNGKSSYWLALRTAVKASVYPSGVIATAADSSSTVPVVMSDGTVNVTQYVTTQPGGRAGGTALYCHLWAPTVAAVGKCLVWLGGHIQTQKWYTDGGYCNPDGASIIRRMHARGWHVLAVDMPSYGMQPIPATVVLNSTPPVQIPVLVANGMTYR